jgi:hypothetical protein
MIPMKGGSRKPNIKNIMAIDPKNATASHAYIPSSQ